MPVYNPVHDLSATIVVAANDSGFGYNADYWCDGTADDVEIQAALDALPAANGRVILLEGTYNCIADISVGANKCLEGQGFNTILNFTDSAIENAITVAGDNVRLANFKAQLAAGAGATNTRPNVVRVVNRTNCIFENLWIVGDTSVADDGSDTRQCGMHLQLMTYCKVINCRIEDNDRHSIYFYNSDYNIIEGNTFEGNTQNGIKVKLSDRNEFIGNTFQGNTLSGITVDHSHHNTISGNISQGNGSTGIALRQANNNTLTGNTFQGNTTHGITIYSYSSNNTLSGNTSQGNGSGGMYLCDHSCNNTVTGNTFQGNTRDGILIFNATNNNTITGNTFADNNSGGGTYSGIRMISADENVISGNQCDGNGLHGIYIYRSSHCTISGNVCNNQNTGDGINVTGDATINSDYNSIVGNVCHGNADDGIAIEGAGDANKNIVVANMLYNNTGTNLVNNGTDTQLGHNITV